LLITKLSITKTKKNLNYTTLRTRKEKQKLQNIITFIII
jgi:hypothetical protein